jgi:uncharacterized membrane protein YphA (DoxX/SURF4 family)
MDRNELGLVVLRYAVGGVFLWFGIDKFLHPDAWLGWAPEWMLALAPLESPLMLFLQGLLESFLGLALVSGMFARLASIVTTLLLLAISVSISWTETTVRDIGLLGASFAIFIMMDGSGKRSISPKRLATFVSLYAILVFYGGVMFLRA